MRLYPVPRCSRPLPACSRPSAVWRKESPLRSPSFTYLRRLPLLHESSPPPTRSPRRSRLLTYSLPAGNVLVLQTATNRDRTNAMGQKAGRAPLTSRFRTGAGPRCSCGEHRPVEDGADVAQNSARSSTALPSTADHQAGGRPRRSTWVFNEPSKASLLDAGVVPPISTWIVFFYTKSGRSLPSLRRGRNRMGLDRSFAFPRSDQPDGLAECSSICAPAVFDLHHQRSRGHALARGRGCAWSGQTINRITLVAWRLLES